MHGRPRAASARRLRRTGLRTGRHVGTDDYFRAVGELGEAARRHLLAVRDAVGDLDPAVAQVDAEADLALVRDVLLDDEELGHAGERGERAAGDGNRPLGL